MGTAVDWKEEMGLTENIFAGYILLQNTAHTSDFAFYTALRLGADNLCDRTLGFTIIQKFKDICQFRIKLT